MTSLQVGAGATLRSTRTGALSAAYPAPRASRPAYDIPGLALGGADADADGLLRTMGRFSADVTSAVYEGVGHHLPEECPEGMVHDILDFWSRKNVPAR